MEYALRNQPCEIGMYVDDAWNILWIKKGTSKCVDMACPDSVSHGKKFYHNHPDDEDGIGGTLSAGDILTAYSSHEKETRAGTPRALYSLRPLDGKPFSGDEGVVIGAMTAQLMEMCGCTEREAREWLHIDEDESLLARAKEFLGLLRKSSVSPEDPFDENDLRFQEKWVDGVADRLGLEFRVWRWS